MSLNPVAPGAGARGLHRGIVTANPQALAHPAYQDASYAGGSGPFLLLRLSICAVLPFIIALGALFQAQILVLHGHILFNTAALKALVILLFTVGLILRSRISNTQVVMATLIFVGYLILDGLRFYFGLNIAGIDVLQGDNTYYSYVFIAVLALLVPYRISERRVIQIFVLTFTVCAVIGLAQFIANSPIIPTHSNDGSFNVVGFEDFGTFRPFSLFLNAETFGLVGVPAAALGLSFWRKRRGILPGLLFLSGAFVTVIAKSRMNYPALVAALATVILLTRGPRRTWHRLLPLLWFLLGVSVLVVGLVIASGGGVTKTVTDTSTLIIRINNWGAYFAEFTMNNPTAALFGFGLVENNNVGTNATVVPIDNLFLCTALHIGVVGLVLTLIVAWVLWREVLLAAQETGSALAIAVAATFSTMLCLGMFQATLGPVCSYFLLYAVSQTATFRRARSAIA